ncbi:M23 family metallopeptidase [Nocardioides sp. LHG3406-4]|uniref:M23 family metallopeptidase n=1 Tax=Nocardioides sp. LHG3406-4 TaxID=2804575 RepID=UPI003CF1DB52
MMRMLGPVVALLLSASPVAAAEADPRWVFYSRDTTAYTSPWYPGAHRTMIGYGCTRAPYYPPDGRCGGGHGFHHGIDVALPCGTPIRAGRRGRVVSSAAYGPAYGVRPLVIRNQRLGVDILIAHARTLLVEVGDRVGRGTTLALASDSGAPDGCHLHFEVRDAGGGLDDARRPLALLDREPA